jgi:hypothetical protein
MKMRVRVDARLFLIMVLLSPFLAPAISAPAATSGYSVSRNSDGIQLTVHFQRRAYPDHALVAVTATLRNLSHQHLAVDRATYPYGPCSGPAVSIVAVNAAGQIAEPVSPIPYPARRCPAPIPRPLAIGRSMTEHQLIVLWAPRLRVTAQLFNFVHHCYCGFTFPATPVRLRLYAAPAPTVAVKNTNGGVVATVSPPAGTQGPLYYQSWGSCPDDQTISGALYWTPWPDRQIVSMCAHPRQWHLDAAWLNTPVASLNLGA